MIDIANKLAKPFSFVRVDLYYINDRIYFGEMTFTPQSGLDSWGDYELDLQYGTYLELPQTNS